MSLINDALRKAQAANKAVGTTTAAAGPAFRQELPTQHREDDSVFPLPFLIAIALVISVVLIWGWNRPGTVELIVRGNSRPQATEPAAPQTVEPAPSTESSPAAVAVPAGQTNELTLSK